MDIFEAVQEGVKNYNTFMFYTASTVVLAPVAGLTAVSVDATLGIAAYISGEEEDRKIAVERFWHIPTSLVCAIPGVATIGLIYLTTAEWISSNGRSVNSLRLVRVLS